MVDPAALWSRYPRFGQWAGFKAPVGHSLSCPVLRPVGVLSRYLDLCRYSSPSARAATGSRIILPSRACRLLGPMTPWLTHSVLSCGLGMPRLTDRPSLMALVSHCGSCATYPSRVACPPCHLSSVTSRLSLPASVGGPKTLDGSPRVRRVFCQFNENLFYESIESRFGGRRNYRFR